MRMLSNDYCWSLNSGEMLDPVLPLVKSKAIGGTMILWKVKLDPFITVIPVTSTAFLPVLLNPPGSAPSVHVAIYLPTLGQERQFLDELSKLSITMDDISPLAMEILNSSSRN